jgi:hypothetical protein
MKLTAKERAIRKQIEDHLDFQRNDQKSPFRSSNTKVPNGVHKVNTKVNGEPSGAKKGRKRKAPS